MYSQNCLKILSIIACLIGILSCSEKTYDNNFNGAKNNEDFYIVDTIKIQEPVRIHSPKFGGMFIVSKSTLKLYKGNLDFFYRSDVFMLSSNLYYDLPINEYRRFIYKDNGGCDNMMKSNLRVKGLEVYEYKGDILFILGLINSNFYHRKHNSYSYFEYKRKDNISFYKVVYPLCQ